MSDEPAKGCMLGLGVCFILAGLLVLALLLWGPEAVAAMFLTVSVGVGMTVCLANLADGK